MGVIKWYEISCETCAQADQYRHNIKEANNFARQNGWIITADGKYFCSKECYKADSSKLDI